MGPKNADALGGGEVIVNDVTSSSSFSTKAPRLRTASDWPDWDLYLEGIIYDREYDDQWKEDGDARILAKLYGVIASTVSGKAVLVVRNAACKGNGWKAYKALEKEFGGQRAMERSYKVRDGFTGRQGEGQSTDDYLIDKRKLWTELELSMPDQEAKSWENLWNLAKTVGLITNLNNKDLVDFLMLEVARKEAAGAPLTYDEAETTIKTFSDGRKIDTTSNVALSGTEEKKKKKAKPKKQGNGQMWQGGFQGYGQGNGNRGGGGRGYGEWWVNRGPKGRGGGKGSKKQGKGKGKEHKDSASQAEEGGSQWYQDPNTGDWWQAVTEEPRQQPEREPYSSSDSDEEQAGAATETGYMAKVDYRTAMRALGIREDGDGD